MYRYTYILVMYMYMPVLCVIFCVYHAVYTVHMHMYSMYHCSRVHVNVKNVGHVHNT